MKVFCVLAATTCISLCAIDVVIPVTKTDWQHHNAVSETIPDGLRVRIPTSGKKTWGSIGRYVSAAPGYFLQVKLGDMESAAAAPFCSNASKNGGRIGSLYSGLNTFKMPKLAAGDSFYCSFGMLGTPSAKVGPWVDFKEVRITENPLNTPVVSLVSGDVAKVGSKLEVRLRTAETVSGKIHVRFFLAPRIIDYRFNNMPQIELTPSGKNDYSATIEIDKNALSFQSAESKFAIMAMTQINGQNCYYALPFAIDVSTGNKISTALADAGSLQVRDDRKLWLERVRGIDLTRNTPLVFSPPPNYSLTTDPHDPLDLTRGRLTDRSDDRVWFDKHAVGWYFGTTRVFIKLDLGKVEPVGKLVIRLLGGTTGNFKFPSGLDLYVSKDGKDYHQTASMKKLAPCESNQCDWKRYYYLEESAPVPNTRMYPFQLDINADARYIILEISGETGAIFSDALACLKADKKNENYNAAYKTPGIEIPMEGLLIRPRIPELAVMAGLPAPQRFVITDMRTDEDRKKNASLVVELPQGMSAIGEKGEKLPSGATRYVYDLSRMKGAYLFPGQTIASPTFYFSVSGPVSGKAVVYARSGGVDQFKTELPVNVVVPPPVAPFRRLHVSLSWMGEEHARKWPDFLKDWQKLGFNTVSTFPRFWHGPAAIENGKAFVGAARAAGYKIIMNDSSFHEMVRGKKAGNEIYCQIPGRTHTMLCPTYRGDAYQKEMERVRRCVRDGKPDFVFYDIEIWHDAHTSAPVCDRCKDGMKKSGQNLDDYLYAKGAEVMADLKQAVKQGAKDAGISVPVIASYNRQPLHPKYGIEFWNSTYPSSLDMAQPSLYVAGRAQDVHDNIRGNHRLLGNKKLIPWLSTGCYGEFDSYKVEQMVLEALMNGAQGVTYYCFDDFTDSPLDFYYHLKALAEIRPYEDLVMDGVVTEISGSVKEMTYSMLRNKNEALLLVGNYQNAPPETTVELPFAPTKILDLRAGGTPEKAEKRFTFNVPKGDIRLFYIRQ